MHAKEPTGRRHGGAIGCVLPPDDADDQSSDLEPELTDPGDLEIDDMPCPDDDSYWDVFIPDEDERDPLPEPGDFWIEESQESRVKSREPEGQLRIDDCGLRIG